MADPENESDTVTLDGKAKSRHSPFVPSRITIKELHATTGEHVRRIGAGRVPVVVTDRGRPVAVLASLSAVKARRRERVLLPEFTAMMARGQRGDALVDLDAVRGDR
jgi:prevent-host-death family protein